MAGRADEGEPAARGGLDRGAGCEEASLERRRRGDRVEVEPRRRLDRFDPLDVAGSVAALEIRPRRGAGLVEGKRGLQRQEPLLGLGVPVRRVETAELGVAQEVDLTASASVSRSAPL
jgi:hypothetical protein